MKKASFWIIFCLSLGCMLAASFIQPLIKSYFGNNTILPDAILIILLSLCSGLIASKIDNKFHKK